MSGVIQQLIKWREVTDSGAQWMNLRDNAGTEINPARQAQFPSALGQALSAASLSVTLASDYLTPQLPASLGPKPRASSLSVTLASDQPGLVVSDVLVGPGTQGNVTVGTTPVEVKVGATRLTARKRITAFNVDDNTMYWGFTNTVSATTGTPLYRNSMLDLPANDTCAVWVVASQAGRNIRVTECP